MEELRFELGRVIAALPYHNQYVVRFVGKQVTSVATALDEAGDPRGGTASGPTYLPGTSVLTAVLDESSDAFKQYGMPHLIVGAFSPFPLHRNNTNIIPRDIVLDSPSEYNFNEAYRRLIENEYIPFINQDRSYNRAKDAVPGDWYKSTVLGGVFLLSDFLTRVGASERCFLEMSALTDELVGSLDGMDIDGEASRLRLKGYGDRMLRIASDAFNRTEGLGATAGNSPFQEPEEPVEGDLSTRVECLSDAQRGFFRLEELAGGAVEGYIRALKSDIGNVPDGVYEDGNAVFPGVLREDARMDGKYRLQAMKELRLEKRPFISVPYEIAEEEVEDPPETELADPAALADDREGLETLLGGADQLAQLQHLFPDQMAELDSLFQQQTLRGKPTLWKFPTQEELADSLGGASPTIPPLPDDAPAYTLEDLANIVAEIYPGRPVRIYKNSSIFLMADDGGMALRDGYGSEIRMDRGNIIIAPAADLKIQPGRDSVEWVPRNKIVKVRKRAEITSSQDSVVIKAEENLQLLSGNGGVGSTVIENRALNTAITNVGVGELKNGLAVAAGVHIRSTQAGVSVLGSYIYGGGYTNGADSTSGLDPVTCNILLDAGPGLAVMRGQAVALLGTNSVSVSMDGTSSGMYADGSGMTLVGTAQIACVAPIVSMQGGRGARISKPFVNDNGVQSRQVNLGTFPSSLTVNGVITCGSGMQIRGDLAVTGSGGANGGFGVPQQRINVSVIESRTVGDAPSKAGLAVENVYDFMTAIGVQTEYGQAVLQPAFPDSDSLSYEAESFGLVETAWQQRLEGTNTWVESEVAHSILEEATLPYPGRAAYENAVGVISSVSVEDGQIAPVKKTLAEYKVNTNR